MLSVIFTILKILGISILIILGVIIVLLLLILFVPVRYKANGEYKDKRIDLTARATWFLHIISVKFFYNNETPFHIRVSFLGIPLYDNLRKKAKEEKKEKKKKLENVKTEIQAASEKSKKEENELKSKNVSDKQSDDDTEIDVVTEKSSEVTNVKDNDCLMDSIEKDDEVFSGEKDKEKNTIFEKISIKIENIVNKIKYTIKKLYDTILKIKDNVEYYVQLFQKERTKRAVEKIKNRLTCVLKNLKPKKIQLNLHLGFDNPEIMGKIMAVNGMLYPVHLGKIAIIPEFDQNIIEGNFGIKGRINIYVYVWTLLIILLDKDIKLLIKRLKIN